MSTESRKISNAHGETFSTCLEVNSIDGFKRKKYLKSTIKAPIKSYLNLSIEQKKDKNYKSACKHKLGKSIQSLIAIDENTSIIKCSDHAVKVRGFFLFCKMKVLLKPIISLNLLRKNAPLLPRQA